MKVNFVSYETRDGSDAHSIAIVEVAACPRVGDRVLLFGLVFARVAGVPRTIRFNVVDVCFEIDLDELSPESDPVCPDVVLEVDEIDDDCRFLTPRLPIACVCTGAENKWAKQPDPSEPERCARCSGLLPIVK